MRIDCVASHPHYIDHVARVWQLLPDDVRGDFITALTAHAASHGIESVTDGEPKLALVLSARDMRRLRCPVVYLEHGVGQEYNNRPHTVRSEQVKLFLTNPANAHALAKFNPKSQVVTVGPVKLDTLTKKPRSKGKQVVAFSHHWDQRVAPETRSSFPWIKEAWEDIAASRKYTLLGHKHPADKRDIEGWCQEMGVEFVADFQAILDRADCYVCDNSSTLYEFAATDRPVVCLSPPFYRRSVNHNARFWGNLPGIDCGIPTHLSACIAEALKDVPERRAMRLRAVEAVYGALDGNASQRAADAIAEFVRLLD
jgi:hypothetical protein